MTDPIIFPSVHTTARCLYCGRFHSYGEYLVSGREFIYSCFIAIDLFGIQDIIIDKDDNLPCCNCGNTIHWTFAFETDPWLFFDKV